MIIRTTIYILAAGPLRSTAVTRGSLPISFALTIYRGCPSVINARTVVACHSCCITPYQALITYGIEALFAGITIWFSPTEIAIAGDSAFVWGCAIPMVIAWVRCITARHVFCATTVNPVIPVVAVVAVGGEVVIMTVADYLAVSNFTVSMSCAGGA